MNRSAAGRDLPATSYAVLGLISFGEMSGYDLKQLADRSIGHFFWSPASSQIYAELRRLTSLGYITEREVKQERRPDKRLYRITQDGEEALLRWLEGGRVVRDAHKSLLLLKLFFGRLTSPSALIAQLEERRRQMQENLAEFEETERYLEDKEHSFYPYLTLKSGIAHTHADLVWLDYAIEELYKRTSQERPAE